MWFVMPRREDGLMEKDGKGLAYKRVTDWLDGSVATLAVRTEQISWRMEWYGVF